MLNRYTIFFNYKLEIGKKVLNTIKCRKAKKILLRENQKLNWKNDNISIKGGFKR